MQSGAISKKNALLYKQIGDRRLVAGVAAEAVFCVLKTVASPLMHMFITS